MSEEESASAFTPAERVQAVPPSGIRRFFELAEEADDVVSLGVGEPDFSAPWAARSAAIDGLQRGKTSYTANRGMKPLRTAISGHVDRQYDLQYGPEQEILVTTGVSEAVDLALRALINPGDTVAVPAPSYVSYCPVTMLAGADVCSVPTAQDGFVLTREALAASGAETADALLLCYPTNPTGTVIPPDELERIAAFAREHDLLVFADEIYADLSYSQEHVSIATLPGMRERTIVFNGFSKAYAMTGLRLGYVLGPRPAIAAMNKIHQYTMLSAPTTAQQAAVSALDRCDDAVEEMVTAFDRRRSYAQSRLDDIGLGYPSPGGSFYLFPETPTQDDEAFAERLLTEAGVAVVPGSVFGDDGAGHVRLSYATGIDQLETAFDRIETVL